MSQRLLSDDEIDDLLYFSRINELSEFQSSISGISKQRSVSSYEICHAAVDPQTGNSVLHYAAANGNLDVLKLILDASRNAETASTNTSSSSLLSLPNESGNTPLHYASLNGQLDALKLLVDALPSTTKTNILSHKNKAGHDAAYEAEGNGKEDVVTYLLGVMDELDAANGQGGVNDEEDIVVKAGVGADSAENGNDVGGEVGEVEAKVQALNIEKAEANTDSQDTS